MYYSLVFLSVFAAILQLSEALQGHIPGPNPQNQGQPYVVPPVVETTVDEANSTSTDIPAGSTTTEQSMSSSNGTTVASPSTTSEPAISTSTIQADSSIEDANSTDSLLMSFAEQTSPSTQQTSTVATTPQPVPGKPVLSCPNDSSNPCIKTLHSDVEASQNKEKYIKTYGVLKTQYSNGVEYPIPQDTGNVSWHKIKVPYTGCELLIGYAEEGVFQQNNCIQLEIEEYAPDHRIPFQFEGSLTKYNSAGSDVTTKKTVKFLSTNVHLYIKTEQGKITVFSHDDIMTLDVPTEPNPKLAAKLVNINGTQVPFFAEYSSFHPNLRKNIYSKANKKFDKKESDKKAKVKPYNSQAHTPYNHLRVFAFNVIALVWAIAMKFLVSAILKYKCPKLSKKFGMPDKVEVKAVNMDEAPEPAVAVRRQTTPTNQHATPTPPV